MLRNYWFGSPALVQRLRESKLPVHCDQQLAIRIIQLDRHQRYYDVHLPALATYYRRH